MQGDSSVVWMCLLLCGVFAELSRAVDAVMARH